MIKLFSNHLNLAKRNASRPAIGQCVRQYVNDNNKHQQSTKPAESNEIEPLSITEQSHNDLGHFDIVINGGGIVGLTCLLNLQRNPFLNRKRILLIEQQNPPKSPANDQQTSKRILSNRVSSLTESSKRCFEQNGIWPEIDPYAKRIREMQIWSTSLNKAISFDTHDLDELKNVAYIVENNRILAALNRSLKHDQILYSTNVVEVLEVDDQINLFTSSKTDSTSSKLTCSLLIGCDGFNSLVRHKSNLKYFSLPVQQNGVVGTISMEFVDAAAVSNKDNSISFQRFLPDRTVVAILPLTNEESSFVISTSKEFAKQLVEMDDQAFVDQFNNLLSGEVESSLPSLVRNVEQLVEKNLPIQLIKSTRNRSLPKITAVQEKSRASFPLGFGTTLPSLVGGIGKSSNINLAIIGN